MSDAEIARLRKKIGELESSISAHALMISDLFVLVRKLLPQQIEGIYKKREEKLSNLRKLPDHPVMNEEIEDLERAQALVLRALSRGNRPDREFD